jgi:hypothetical protein
MPGFMRTIDMNMTEQIISDLQARNSGLEDNLNRAGRRIQVLEMRERQDMKTMDSLQAKLTDATKHPRGYAIHEALPPPSVRWVTYRNFLKLADEMRGKIADATRDREITQDKLRAALDREGERAQRIVDLTVTNSGLQYTLEQMKIKYEVVVRELEAHHVGTRD